jgi:hypothetical protein
MFNAVGYVMHHRWAACPSGAGELCAGRLHAFPSIYPRMI